MGDAELCGTGIEIPAEITVKVSLVKGFELHWPVLETFGAAGKWYVNASAQEFDEALMNASKELQRLLMRITGWDAVETYMYMSVQRKKWLFFFQKFVNINRAYIQILIAQLS